MSVKNEWLAEALLDYIISSGKKVKRPKNPSIDRKLRNLIADSVTNRKVLIINNGDGYFVPDVEDGPQVTQYCNKERARAKAITDRIDAIEEMFNDIKEALPEGSTTKTIYIVNENQGDSNDRMENKRTL